MSEKVSRGPHWKDSACSHHGITQETAHKFLWSQSRSPRQFSLSSCVATSFFERQTSSWTMAKSGQKELRNSLGGSSVRVGLLLLGFLPRYVKAVSGLNNLDRVTILAYTLQNHHWLKGAMCEVFSVFPIPLNTDALGFPGCQTLMLGWALRTNPKYRRVRLSNHLSYTLHLKTIEHEFPVTSQSYSNYSTLFCPAFIGPTCD